MPMLSSQFLADLRQSRLGDTRRGKKKSQLTTPPLVQYSLTFLFLLPFLSPQNDPPCACLGFLSAFLERDRVEYSDSILPINKTYGHFILIYVPCI